jgi:molybdopterin molybdotransferase
MLSFEQAKKAILVSVPAPGTETVTVRSSLGRVLAEEIRAPRDFPDTRISAMDGYAVRFGSGSRFEQIAVIAAGELPEFTLEPGQCAAVMTGGTVPGGTDCVVKVEDCEVTNGTVEVRAGLEPGAYINEPAFEAPAGKILLRPGVRIHRAAYPALFYAGISEVEVYRRVRPGILITGSELREVEAGQARGRIFNTNLYILESLLDSIAVDCGTKSHVPDDEAATREALESLAASCDVIICSGGISKGRYDYIKKILNGADYSLIVNGTAIKPGSPLMVAKRGGRLFFGMPGYPAAFLTNALLYLIPALKKAGGLKHYEHRWISARLTTPMRSRKGKLYFNRAVLEPCGDAPAMASEGARESGKELESNKDAPAKGQGQSEAVLESPKDAAAKASEEVMWTARDPGSQKTSNFLNFTEVNGLVLLPETVGTLEPGAIVRALHFDLELGL